MKRVRKQLKKKGKAVSQSFFPTPKEIMQKAYNEARKVWLSRKFSSKPLKAKSLNALKAKKFGETLQAELHGLSKTFPGIEEMNPFHRDLFGAITDVDRLKKNLAALNASSKVLKKIRSSYGKKFFSAGSAGESQRLLKEFEGRSASVLKKLGKPLAELKSESKKLREMPSINFELDTIVLSGHPNTGKSTILKRLTGSKAEISHYQFTTKQINVGHFEFKYRKIQVIDTPGLLDRKSLNSIEKKAVAALKHLATIIIFVIDPTQACGFTIREQLGLLKKIREEFREKRIIVVANKNDVAGEKETREIRETEKNVVTDGEDLKGRNLRTALEEELKSIWEATRENKAAHQAFY